MITSSANTRIKAIRKLRDRKERQNSQLSYIEGLRLVVEAIQLGADIVTILFSPELLTSAIGKEILSDAKLKNYEILELSAQAFKSIAIKDDPQGIAAVIRQKWFDLATIHPDPKEMWLALVEVADPGNLGSIMRTLESVNGKGIILLDQSTDPYDLTALRASMGALFSLKLVKTNLEDFSDWIRARQIKLIGADDNGDKDYHFFHYPRPMILLMGSERKGFQQQHIEICDSLVRIPMTGRSDSLNLAVATSIILYEVFNQEREAKGQR